MVGSYELGRHAAPALGAARLVGQRLADDGQRRPLGPDFLDNSAGSRQPLPGAGVRGGAGWEASLEAHLGSGELVTRPDVHVVHGIRWPQRTGLDADGGGLPRAVNCRVDLYGQGEDDAVWGEGLTCSETARAGCPDRTG